MTISLKHPFTSPLPDGNDPNLIRPSNWNAEHTLTLAADRILGRISSAGTAQEIGIGTGLAFSGGNLILDTDLSDLSALTPTDSNIIVGNGTNWVTESGDTARISLGIGSTDSPQFTAVNIGHATDTTITRVSAGVAAVEGSNILLASGLGSITQAYDATLASIAALGTAADKIAYTTGIDTWAETALTSAARSILDDTTVGAIATTLGLGTGDSPQFTAVNLGHATDTTIARVSAGLISVEGDTVALLTATQTLTNKTLTAPDINAGTADSLTSLSIRSTGAAFDLTFATAEVLGAGRTLSWVLGDAARTITLSGNPTLNDWFDQSVKTTANPQFATIELGAASDTTLARVSAGVVSIEGVTVATASNALALTSKTIDLTSNTLVGSVTEFNTALESADFGTFAAGQTDNAAVRADGTGGLLQTSALIISDTADLTAYDATNDGNPVFAFGASATERLTVTPTYDSAAQTLNFVLFQTDVASATADKGLFRFAPDGATILDIDDGGINFAASKGISIAGTDILTDSAGTATLSNIDALDATTEATIEAAIDTLANLTSIQSVTFTFGAYAATVLNNANEAAFKQAVNLEIGVDVQAYDADLSTWAGITPGTGVGTALAVNIGSAGAFVVNGGALGTPSSGTLTNATGLPSILAANEATDTTCFPCFFTAATGELGPKSNANLTFNSSTGALGATSFVGALTGNADTVTWANEATDTTCFIGFATAASGSLAPKTNANMTFNSSTGVATLASAVLTTADINAGTLDGVTIGGASAAAATVTTLGCGAITSTGLLTVSLAGNAARFLNTTDNASVQAARFEGDRATMADNDEAYASFMLSNDGGTQTEFGRLSWVATDVNAATSVDGRLDFAVVTAGSLADEMQLDGTALSPSTSDGLALGTASLMWSDFFLASGSVINWNNGDITLTHSADTLAVVGGAVTVTGTVAADNFNAVIVKNTANDGYSNNRMLNDADAIFDFGMGGSTTGFGAYLYTDGLVDIHVYTNATKRLTIDTSGHVIALSATATPPTLATNGQWVMTPTSNTNMRISYRGSDGTTRVGNITLA